MNRIRMLTLAVLLVLLAGCGAPAGSTEVPASEPPGTTLTAGPEPTPTLPAPATVAPTPAGPQAVVVDVINDVDAHALPGGEWAQALVDMVLYLGGEVWAREASTARVEIERDLVRVAPNTIFTFSQPDADTMQIELQTGQIWIDVEGLAPGEEFDVETPSAVASVRGTLFSVRVAADGSTIVSSRAETVTVFSAAGAVSVTAGLQTAVFPNQAPTDPVTMTVEEQTRWGLAAGPGLGVVLPAAGDPVACFGFPKYAGGAQFAGQGNWFAFTLHGENHETARRFYDLGRGEFVSVTLPDSAHFDLNPVDASWAYTYYTDHTYYVCTGNPDGSDTACAGGEADAFYGSPDWSPDGQWVLFYGGGGTSAGYDLFKLERGETEITRLTDSPGSYDVHQIWSPDSRWIAYINSPEYGAVGDVWVMGADGSDPHMIFQGVGEHGSISWSPDGEWLAVPAEVGGLWLVRPDGSDPHELIDLGPGRYSQLIWSPSPGGWPLLVGFYGEGQPKTLHYVAGDGQVPGYLGAFSWGPIWSPDGSRMALGYNQQLDPDEFIYQSDFCVFDVQTDFWP